MGMESSVGMGGGDLRSAGRGGERDFGIGAGKERGMNSEFEKRRIEK
jgi:hypothetical protein